MSEGEGVFSKMAAQCLGHYETRASTEASRLLGCGARGGMVTLKTAKEHDQIMSHQSVYKLVNWSAWFPWVLIRTQCTGWNPSAVWRLAPLSSSLLSSPPLSPHTSLFPFSIPLHPQSSHWLIHGVSSVCSILSKEPDFRHQSQSSSRWGHTNAHVLTHWNDILGVMVRVCCVISWNHLDFPSSPCFPLKTLFNCL